MTEDLDSRPRLVYDGECDFCRVWVDYWKLLTREQVVYEPFQSAAGRYPHIPRANFEQAVHFVQPDGAAFRGAEAVFRLLALAPGFGGWLWAYRRVPGFVSASEWFYRLVADHRDFFYKLTNRLWGVPLVPAGYQLVRELFLRGLGLVYFVAFASLAVQVRGLIGPNGLLPAAEFFAAVQQRWGLRGFVLAPSIFWFNSSDVFLQAVPIAGALLALAMAAGWHHWSLRALLYAGYLSLLWAGQDFLAFQWDNLLLEAGFLAIFLDAALPAGIWLGRWLLFRLMFLSGMAKLLSGDISWRLFTALTYHYQTQPLPTALGWFAHHLPAWFQRFSTFSTLIIEAGVPFLIFLPRRVRFVSGAAFAALMVLIALTGNFAFFNWLALVICLFVLDDAALQRLLPARLLAWLSGRARPSPQSRARRVVAGVSAALIVLASVLQMVPALGGHLPGPALTAARAVRPFRIANTYGLFAVMTVWRPEVVIEGSNDGQTWQEYEFKFKPGDLRRRPGWVAPYQPRLDWQMWFAALGNYQSNQWFVNLMARLLQGSPDVLALMGRNPFPDAPPRYIRATLYSYEYTDLATLQATGEWWKRERVAEYFPEVELNPSP